MARSGWWSSTPSRTWSPRTSTSPRSPMPPPSPDRTSPDRTSPDGAGPDSTLVTPQVLRAWPRPEPTGGKNSRGSILVIGGSSETLGAVLLAAEAALRAGAGKLQVATAESVAPFAATALPEALVRALPQSDSGAIRAEGADVVRELAE